MLSVRYQISQNLKPLFEDFTKATITNKFKDKNIQI